jgi:membrane protease YdiL (CAAX protease family)
VTALSPLQSALFKVALPFIVIGCVLFAARKRRLPWRETLGLRSAPVRPTLLFIAIYVVWMLATNAVIGWRGPWDFTIWRTSPLLVDVLRVLAVGILGPLAEELLFRGLMQGMLARKGRNAFGTIALPAIIWAAIHINYSITVIAILFVAGLLLGASRWRTGSIVPAILMHVIWNLYAVW